MLDANVGENLEKQAKDLRESFIQAVQTRNVDAIYTLLINGANPDTEIINRESAIEYAIEKGWADVAEILINFNADLKLKSSYLKYTPLMLACRKGVKKIVKAIVEKNPRLVNDKSKNGETPLIIACKEGDEELVEFLISMGARVNNAKGSGSDALHVACLFGFKNIAEYLLNKGALLGRNSHGAALMSSACKGGNIEIVKMLIERGVDINEVSITGETGFIIACMRRDKEIVKLLLENNAQVNIGATSWNNRTAIENAWEWADEEIINLFIKQGLNVNTFVNESPLLLLAYDAGFVI